jgi:hypothetical protein
MPHQALPNGNQGDLGGGKERVDKDEQKDEQNL